VLFSLAQSTDAWYDAKARVLHIGASR